MAALIAVGSSCASRAQELSKYWDDHDFHSVASFEDIRSAEAEFEGYIRLLEKVPADVAVRSMYEFLDSAALNKVAYTLWAGWFEAYLHILESPYNNEFLFQAWLDKVTSDGILDDYMMEHLMQIKNVSGLNAVGTAPCDVRLQDVDGTDFRISDLRGRRTLLFFFNGGCRSCADYMSEIYKEYRRTDTHLVAVLLNAAPEILSAVDKTLNEDVSSRWTLAWCPGRELENGQIYDLTLIPSKILVAPDGLIERSYHK